MDSLLTLENSNNTILDLTEETNLHMAHHLLQESHLHQLLAQRLPILLVNTTLLVIQLIQIASTVNSLQE